VGCRKLSYYEKEAPEVNALFLVKGLEKKGNAEKNRVNYYPFGLEHRGLQNQQIGAEHPYTYQGKQKHEDFGLNVIQMDWRNYQPDLGRFFNVDPLAEEAPDWSPFRAFFNNPIIFSDPSGLYETRYEDENGDLIVETDDGNDATVLVSDEDKADFVAEFFKYSTNIQNDEGMNASWISRFGSGIRAEPGDNVSSWALDAIFDDGSTQVGELENVTKIGDGFEINPLGPALVLLGQKFVPKPGGLGGGGKAGKWTSPASKVLRKADKLIQTVLNTNKKLPGKSFLAKKLGTRGIGAAGGRLVPVVGTGLLVWDIWELSFYAGYYYGPSHWYGENDQKIFE